MTAPSDLVGTATVAEITGKQSRTVEWWVAEGRLAPSAVVSGRNLWPRQWVEGWAAQGCPPGASVPEVGGLLGVEDVADLLGLTVAGVRSRLNEDRNIVQPAARVSGALIFSAPEFYEWMAQAEGVTA